MYTRNNNTSHSVTRWRPPQSKARSSHGPRCLAQFSAESFKFYRIFLELATLDEQLSIPSHILAANTQYGSRQAG